MYRPPARSRAAPTTLCQKCLQRDIYECKAAPGERPYVSRPSRTQQLLNPKLVPKLNSEVPNDLLRKKGVADEQLAKNAEERGRKHSRDGDDISAPTRKRSRSVSSYSSVSTVSSGRSPSRSPSPYREKAKGGASRHNSHRGSAKAGGEDRKRRRRSMSSSARSYDSRRSPAPPRASDRNTRRRRSSFSPVERGRQQSRSVASERNGMPHSRSQRRSRSRGYGSPPRRDGGRYTRSPARAQNDAGRRPPSPAARPARPPTEAAGVPPVRKERSLSPYSKRIALTQAMSTG